jgi:hypothetical protein
MATKSVKKNEERTAARGRLAGIEDYTGTHWASHDGVLTIQFDNAKSGEVLAEVRIPLADLDDKQIVEMIGRGGYTWGCDKISGPRADGLASKCRTIIADQFRRLLAFRAGDGGKVNPVHAAMLADVMDGLQSTAKGHVTMKSEIGAWAKSKGLEYTTEAQRRTAIVLWASAPGNEKRGAALIERAERSIAEQRDAL